MRWNILIFTHVLRSIRRTQGMRAPGKRAQSGAIPYSGLDDVTIRGLALATLRHRKTPIRRRSYVLGNQPVQELLHLSHYCRMWASVAVWGEEVVLKVGDRA